MDSLFRNYALSCKGELDKLDGFGTVQITLNGKTYPRYRDSKYLFTRLCDRYPHVKFICHYDYYHHVTKFAYYTERVQNQMVWEIKELCSVDRDNFMGIVFHTDSVFRKGLVTTSGINKSVLRKYNSAFYDTQMIEAAATLRVSEGLHPHQLSFEELSLRLSSDERDMIFVETCVCRESSTFGEFNAIISLARDKGFHVCWDTEHVFSSMGWLPSETSGITQGGDIVHLNCIPMDVLPYSYLDRHSETTVFECSRETPCMYKSLAESFNKRGILWVREVSAETRIREQYQLGCNGK